MREKSYLFAMNGGEVSPLALGRVDLSRMRISAEVMKNCFPRVIGPMAARPGLAYLSSTDGDGEARNIPFIFSATDTALVELSDRKLRVRVGGDLISRAAVSTVVTNGDFGAPTGWTLTTTGGGVSTISGGVLTLQTPDRGGTTLAKRSDTVAGGDQNVEHAIEVTVERGPVKFRCGSSDGGDEYITETELKTGFHSIAFTPVSGTYYIQLSAENEANRIVSDVSIATSGVMELATSWAAADLFKLRYSQSGDVIFVTSSDQTYQPMRIERRAETSWSFTDYEFVDGPFRGKTADLTLTPDARTGNGTLTASAPFFKSGHVGSVFRITHQQTIVGASLSGPDRYTDTIRVSGNSRYDIDSDGANENTNERDVVISITGTWVGRIGLQISEDDGETWRRVEFYTTNQSITRTPGSANTVVLCRLGFNSDDYTSGTAVITATYSGGGGGDGYVLITGINSTTSADYEVMSRIHADEVANDWSEGQFSTLRGWPSAVALFEGRLWWGGADKLFGSVSDGFDSFDLEEAGDSGPVIRSVATGAVNAVNWILGLARLCIGTSGAEPVGRSSSFDEPMTPSNFSIKDASTQGSADVQAIKIDRSAVFVQRSGKRAYDLSYTIDAQDYSSSEISRFHPTVLSAGVKLLAVQRQPDTRIWFVLNDGTCAMLTYERSEDVLSWFTFQTDGLIEDVAVLPNVEDDDVFMVVARTVDGKTRRYVERLAYDTQAQGGNHNNMADSYVTQTLVASDTVTGLSHLEGAQVVVWAAGQAVMNGDEPAIFTVSSGQIMLPEPVSGTVVAGLSYDWQWRSAKLAYGVRDGAPLSRRKTLRDVAPILYKTHIRGIRAGQTFDAMDYLPLSFLGETLDANSVLETYDAQSYCIPGTWDTDTRLCLAGQAPLPCTVLSLSLTMEAN
ncbi:MAG: hypothetical protein HKP56_02385 [Anderseniella sp.]|nr:hypothetical protein [Anderseniella sp.]